MKNFNVINVTLLTVGGILIYCGVKDISPKEALQVIITGSKANKKVASVFPETGQGSQGDAFGSKGGKSGGGGGGGGSGSW
jgi:hypothetical protein